MEAYELLEREFAEWVGWGNPENYVACSSGTAALHLAFEAMCLPLGSHVIVPDFTMVACARAVTLAGHSCTFIDCDPKDLTLDTEKFTTAWAVISGTIKAIMPVHVYGRRCNMIAIDTFAERNNLRVVEDLAEAHGVRPYINTDAACWSFYKNKIIAGEEGGMVAFKDARHAATARSLRSLGFTERHDFQHIPRGHNYRMSNCHAELIRVSLKSVEWNQRRRREIEEQYNDYMPHPLVWRMPLQRDAVWVYDLRIPGMTSGQQDLLIKALNERGIAARHAFKPMSQQWEYREAPLRQDSIAALMSREVIYLPVDPRRDCIHKIFRNVEFAEMIWDSAVNAHPAPA